MPPVSSYGVSVLMASCLRFEALSRRATFLFFSFLSLWLHIKGLYNVSSILLSTFPFSLSSLLSVHSLITRSPQFHLCIPFIFFVDLYHLFSLFPSFYFFIHLLCNLIAPYLRIMALGQHSVTINVEILFLIKDKKTIVYLTRVTPRSRRPEVHYTCQ